ncbi:hypothetical protein WR25_01920 isoform D [Diploscapter pachys]|uniref:Uncharacterized protein n=1 Tax=Diploscapter pachys TaxID=2018661 RepID=A0A2A2JSN1_9BILA|nr:hypothetical protein WR25_01920 isoform B [Diploscapter pachys]PAV64671.1 hypothetical protein WR25_01920 isoform D [Diploscapter pachys]
MVTRKAKSPFAAAAQQQQGALLWTDVINSKLKELKEKRSKHNRRLILFAILCVVFYSLACGCSVLSASLDSEKLKASVEKNNKKSKKTCYSYFKYSILEGAESPSDLYIGVINFLGRIFTAGGTVFLLQLIASWCKRKKYDEMIKSAAEEATDVAGETSSGCVETCVECLLSFV